jgi:hypothetical protein
VYVFLDQQRNKTVTDVQLPRPQRPKLA